VLAGAGIGRKIEFERQQFTNQLSISGLENLLQLFMHSIDDETALISPVARRELEQAIVVQFLFACRHNFSPLLERDTSNVAPSQVRLTAEYIDAHWNQPIRSMRWWKRAVSAHAPCSRILPRPMAALRCNT
jgi:hypothetical protein